MGNDVAQIVTMIEQPPMPDVRPPDPIDKPPPDIKPIPPPDIPPPAGPPDIQPPMPQPRGKEAGKERHAPARARLQVFGFPTAQQYRQRVIEDAVSRQRQRLGPVRFAVEVAVEHLALVLAHHPDFKGQFAARNAQRVERLYQIIKESATPMPIADATRVGVGLPNVVRALGLQAGQGPQPSAAAGRCGSSRPT